MELREIKEDLDRAQKALESAQRNFREGDVLTAANRLFVACESAVYAFLKLKYGSISMSRERILTRLKEVDVQLKELYDRSYDLRVQADYGKQSKLIPLTRESVSIILQEVEKRLPAIAQEVNKEQEKKLDQ